LALRRRMQHGALRSLAFVWIPGSLVVGTTGLLVWLFESRIDPQITSSVVLVPLLGWLAWTAWRSPVGTWFRPGETAVCGLVLLVLLVGVGKATWSQGP